MVYLMIIGVIILVVSKNINIYYNDGVLFNPFLLVVQNLPNIYQVLSILIKMKIDNSESGRATISNHCILDLNILSKQNNLLLIIYKNLKLDRKPLFI